MELASVGDPGFLPCCSKGLRSKRSGGRQATGPRCRDSRRIAGRGCDGVPHPSRAAGTPGVDSGEIRPLPSQGWGGDGGGERVFLSRVLGLTQFLNETQLTKQGMRFWFSGPESATLCGLWGEIRGRYLSRVPAWQVDRSTLDEEVLRALREAGAEIRRPAKAIEGGT